MGDEREAGLLAYLGEKGIAYALDRHAPVMTCEEAAATRGKSTGMALKNFFLKDKDKKKRHNEQTKDKKGSRERRNDVPEQTPPHVKQQR